MARLEITPFGREMRENHFLFSKGHVNLNQGSHSNPKTYPHVSNHHLADSSKGAYGSYPGRVRDAMRDWQDAAESQPDKFIRYIFPECLSEIRHQIASFLNADVDGTVFVPNATTGLNTVLRNLVFQPGDKIVYFTGVYGAIGKTVDYLTETTPVTSVEVPFDPSKDDEECIVSRFISSVEEHGNSIRVAIFDTVMSVPGVRMPFERLTKVCRRHGIFSVIDGAHGVGFIDLNIGELDPDFLVTNCHK